MITTGGELYHWKYIKREKKNGKWVYTYDDDPVNTTVNVKDTNKLFSSKTSITLGNSRKDVTYNRGKLERAMDKAKDKLGVKDYLDKREQDWYESTNRATQKAEKEAEKKGLTLNNTDNVLSSKSTLKVGSTVISRRYNRGKIDRFVDTAKEYIKDRLGYDEKDTVEAAIKKYDEMNAAEKKYKEEADAAIRFMGTANPRTGKTDYTEAQKKQIAEIERKKKALSEATERARKEATKASDAYINTPLSKIDSVRKSGEEWFERLRKQRRIH